MKGWNATSLKASKKREDAAKKSVGKRTLTAKQIVLLGELQQTIVRLFGECAPEHKFHAVRRFKFDYAVPSIRLAVEVNGGEWVNGRHNRGGVGYRNDLTKLNLAMIGGWKVLQYNYAMLADGTALKDLQAIHSLHAPISHETPA